MINRTNRAIASVLAFFLVISLVFAPALTAKADDMSATSAELVISTEGMDVNAKLAVDVETGLALLTTLGSNGDTLADLGLYITNSGLIVKGSPNLDQAYGIDLSKIAENLPKSVFAPDSGSSLALDQETFDMVMNFLQSPAEAISAAPAALPVDMDVVMTAVMAYVNFIEQHAEELGTAFMSSAEMNMAPTTLYILDQEVEVSMTTITFGPKALAELFKTAANEIAADQDLLDAFAALFKELAAAGANIEPAEVAGDDGAAVLAQLFSQTGEQIEQTIIGADISVSVTIAADKTTGEPVCIGATAKMGEQELNFAVVMTGNIYGVVMAADGNDMGIYLVIEDVTENGFSAYVTTQVGGSETGRLALTLDFSTGAYTLAITSSGETVTAAGTISGTEDGGFMISLDSVDGKEFPGTLGVVLRDADVISIPDFVEILTMSEEEVATALQGILSLAQGLLSMVGIA